MILNLIVQENKYMNIDSGHTWFNKEDFTKAVKDLEASRAKSKELESLIKYHHGKFKEACRHIKDQAKEHRVRADELKRDWSYLHDLFLVATNALKDIQAEVGASTLAWKIAENALNEIQPKSKKL